MILYFKTPHGDNARWLIWLLMAFRFLSVSIIAFLLTSPFIRKTEETVQKPIIIIGIDNSSSIMMTRDSLFTRNTFPEKINRLGELLSAKYEPVIYSFGERVSGGFSGRYEEKETNISAFLSDISDRYYNRNVGALILATDGIYNSGSDPFYTSGRFLFPVYTIALGDTTLRRDIYIQQIRYNRRVYKGDPFPVEIFFEMDKLQGVSTNLIITQGSKTIVAKEIRATTEKYFQKLSLQLEPEGTGILKFSVNIVPVEGEATPLNNRQDFFVDVLESKEKIAILFDMPHPDINAMRLALEQSERYEVEEFNIKDLSLFTPDKFDLIILNQLPSVRSGQDVMPLVKSGIPLLFILGTQTDINTFNRLNAGLVINASKLSFSEVKPLLNTDFTLFTFPRNAGEFINEWPPLNAPFGLYQCGPMTEKLLLQKISSSTTNIPLVMYIPGPQRKIGIITGENLWRWRLFNFFQQSNFDLFDELIDKTVQYLMVKDDRSLFRISVNPTIRENENVQMQAEVFNASYERITEPEVNITIENSEKKAYPYTFSKSENGYYLNAGFFPPGNYSFNARTKFGSTVYDKKGSFIVIPVNMESLRLIADHKLLHRLAVSHDGRMVPPDKTDSLYNLITAREDIHSVTYFSQSLKELVGNVLVFGLILLLLAVEWFIRKRNSL
jgi:hypothetical protein